MLTNFEDMNKMTFFLILMTILYTACNKFKNELTGGWLIENVYYNNKPVIYDLYTNSFDLNEDNTCNNLPISSINESQPGVETGTWKSYVEKGESYIQIKSKNKIFNRKFRILDLRSEGNLIKMTIASDSVKLICSKVPIY
jgi:hypothetical protein